MWSGVCGRTVIMERQVPGKSSTHYLSPAIPYFWWIYYMVSRSCLCWLHRLLFESQAASSSAAGFKSKPHQQESIRTREGTPESSTFIIQIWCAYRCNGRLGRHGSSQETHYSISKSKNGPEWARQKRNRLLGDFFLIFYVARTLRPREPGAASSQEYSIPIFLFHLNRLSQGRP